MAEERARGGVPTALGWPPGNPGGAADSPLLQGAARVKLRCQVNIPAAAALRGGRGTGMPSLPALPGLLRVPRRASGSRARAWWAASGQQAGSAGRRQRCRRGGCGAASGRLASSDL